jgi:hypothetical protein
MWDMFYDEIEYGVMSLICNFCALRLSESVPSFLISDPFLRCGAHPLFPPFCRMCIVCPVCVVQIWSLVCCFLLLGRVP